MQVAVGVAALPARTVTVDWNPPGQLLVVSMVAEHAPPTGGVGDGEPPGDGETEGDGEGDGEGDEVGWNCVKNFHTSAGTHVLEPLSPVAPS